MRGARRLRVSCAPLGASLLIVVGCVGAPADDSTDDPATLVVCPSAELAHPGDDPRSWIDAMASPRLEGRRAAERGGRTVVAWLAEELASIGFEPLVAARPADTGAARFCQRVPETDDFNVLARLAPEASGGEGRPVVLLSAHYDGRGRTPAGRLLPGADDNASGVAALLEVLRRLATSPPTVEVWAAFFAAEELDHLGSRRFVASPPTELRRLSLIVNLDMVGRVTPDVAQGELGYLVRADDGRADGPRTSRELESARVVRAIAEAGLEPIDLAGVADADGRSSDDASFAGLAPAVLLTTGFHDDYHGPGDVPERVDLSRVRDAVAVVEALVRDAGSG